MESLTDDQVGIEPAREFHVVEGYDETVLVKFVDNKVCRDEDRFSGQVNAVTGELIHGKYISIGKQEFYEGPFFHGERHGMGVCTKLNGEGKFLGEFRHGSYHRGTLITSEYTYIGVFSCGIFHGHGTLIYSDGTLYEGVFRCGEFHGQGKLTTHIGDTYKGGFRDGLKQGYGIMHYHQGDTYEGDWNKGIKDGIGRQKYKSSHEYEGEFFNNGRHGKGTMKTPTAEVTGPWRHDRPLDGPGWTIFYPKTGIQYTGEALCCRPHGYGKFAFPNRDNNEVSWYEGQVLCGLRHGLGGMISSHLSEKRSWKGDILVSNHAEDVKAHGEDDSDTPRLEALESSSSDGQSVSSPKSLILESEDVSDIKVYDNGDTFRGHIDIFGKRQGFGIFTESATGMIYSGQWKSSKKHGRGSLIHPLSSLQYVGTFVEDLMQGHGSLRFPDGSTYTGMFMDGMMHGRGVFVDATNETTYEGEFIRSTKHGDGEEGYADGTIFHGSFVNGKRSGKNGRLYKKDGEVRVLLYEGMWSDDIITGVGKRFQLLSPCNGSYEGAFQDSKRHGHGTFTACNGYIFEGEWSDDSPCDGDWVITCPRGSVYYGEAICKDGIPTANGFGTRNETDGAFYSGQFQMGTRHGSGICVFSSGEQWDGRWRNDTFTKYGRSRP